MINLTAQQQAWLDSYIASGEFSSAEEALAHLIDMRIAEESDDLSWAAPLVEEARAAVARGDVMSLEEHKARNAARRAALLGE